jgi:hypothetical protein
MSIPGVRQLWQAHSGYRQSGDWLIPQEGEEQSYHLILSLEKAAQ